MSSSTEPKIILLRGSPLHGEAAADEAITPGSFVTPVGPVGTVDAYPTVSLSDAASPLAIIARENISVGGGIDDAYAADDNVLFWYLKAGDQVYALLAAGQSVAAGADLSIGASGELVAATPFAQAGVDPFAVTPATPIIARALETVDNDPGTGGAPVRIKVEIV